MTSNPQNGTNDQPDRYAADIQALQDRLGGSDRKHKVTTAKLNRLDYVVAQLGKRLGEDHDTIVTNLTPRLNRLEELVGTGLKVDLAAAIVGFKPEEIKEILAIQAQENLDNSQLVTGMVNSIGLLKKQVGALSDHVVTLTGRVDTHEERLDGHDQRFDTFRNSLYADVNARDEMHQHHVNDAHRRIDSGTISMGFSAFSIGAAAVAFLVIWLGFALGWLGIPLSGSANVGSQHGSLHGGLHHAGFFGFFTGLVVAGIILAIGRTLSLRFDERHQLPQPEQEDVNDDAQPAPRTQHEVTGADTPTQPQPRVRQDERPQRRQPTHS